jgi:hypothetical protein
MRWERRLWRRVLRWWRLRREWQVLKGRGVRL